MIAAATFLLVTLQTPTTFEALELAKIRAYHELKTCREVWEVEIGDQKLGRDSIIDDGQYRVVITVGDGRFISLADKKTSWMLMEPQKVYYESEIKPWTFDPKESLLKAAKDEFQFKFDSNKPMQFALSTEVKLMPIEEVTVDKEKLRKVVALAKNAKGHEISITQWFLPDRWLLKRFSVKGQGDGGPFEFGGVAKVLDLKAKIDPADFKLDPESIKGYQKGELPPTDGGNR